MFEESHWEHNSMIIPMRLVKLCNKGIFKSSDVIRKAIKYLVSLQLNQVRFDLHKHIQHNTSTKKKTEVLLFQDIPKVFRFFILLDGLTTLSCIYSFRLCTCIAKNICVRTQSLGEKAYMQCLVAEVFHKKKARAWCNVIYSLVSKV